MKPSGPGLLFYGRFLITASISMLVIGLFIISISSWFSLGRLNFSKNLSISSRLFHCHIVVHNSLFPGGSDGKASVYNAGDPGLIPGSGRSPGEGNGNPLQYSCLENPMDKEPDKLQFHGGHKESDTSKAT